MGFFKDLLKTRGHHYAFDIIAAEIQSRNSYDFSHELPKVTPLPEIEPNTRKRIVPKRRRRPCPKIPADALQKIKSAMTDNRKFYLKHLYEYVGEYVNYSTFFRYLRILGHSWKILYFIEKPFVYEDYKSIRVEFAKWFKTVSAYEIIFITKGIFTQHYLHSKKLIAPFPEIEKYEDIPKYKSLTILLAFGFRGIVKYRVFSNLALPPNHLKDFIMDYSKNKCLIYPHMVLCPGRNVIDEDVRAAFPGTIKQIPPHSRHIDPGHYLFMELKQKINQRTRLTHSYDFMERTLTAIESITFQDLMSCHAEMLMVLRMIVEFTPSDSSGEKSYDEDFYYGPNKEDDDQNVASF